MRPRSTIALFAFAHGLAVTRALAQPNLPPPPPPPIGEPTDIAPSTSPSASSAAAVASQLPPHAKSTLTAPGPPPAAPNASAAAHRVAPPPPPSPSPLRPGPRRHHTEAYLYESRRRRPVTLTLSPLPLAGGRLCVAAELLIAPHHAVFASPNLLFAEVDRGGRSSFVSEGFGFASTASGGAGIEMGYHYWSHARESLRGMFFGPSILLGDTSQSSVDPSHAQGYWGLALDVG
ncbi:MAG: hypothetical protein WBY94_06070, partial [Polyangiaceae bacterium]